MSFSRSSNSFCVRQGIVQCIAARILMNRNERGNAATFGIGASNIVTRALWRDHPDVDIIGRLDLIKVDVESVGKRYGVARRQVGGYVFGIDCRLLSIWKRHHHDVCQFCRCGDTQDRQTFRFCLSNRG